LRQLSDQSDPYDSIAEFYDQEHDSFDADLAMYRQIVDMVGDPVLELACGSGRILAALAEPGRRLSGIDSSQAMLERCRVRFADQPDRPDLTLASMTEPVTNPGTFGVVIIGLSSLHHLADQPSQIAALRNAHRALDPRGMLVLDLMNPLQALTTEDDGLVHLETSIDLPDRTLSKFSVRWTDIASQTITNRIWYDTTGPESPVYRTQSEMTLRLLYPSELDLMLQLAGFVSNETYGSYELDPFAATSPRLIVTAEKTA
jgi:SAM-dependent methyltransferase